MNRRRVAPVIILIAAAALAVGLSACAPEAAPGPTGSSSAPKPTASGSTSASATPSESPSASASTCLPGTWKMDQAALDTFYTDINNAQAGAGISFTPKGSATLTIGSDGSFSWAPSLELTTSVSGTTILVTIGGQTAGTYTATADRITTQNQSTDGLQVSATIDGVATDPGAITDQIAGAPIGDSSYTCADDTLTLTSDIGGAAATSVLHRG